MKDELTPQQYRKLRENNSYYNSDTPREIINKIKSKKTKDGMQLHAMAFHIFLFMNKNKWADVCEILKKDLPEIHQFLAEKECIPIPYHNEDYLATWPDGLITALMIFIALIPMTLLIWLAIWSSS